MLGTLAVLEPHVTSNCLHWLTGQKYKKILKTNSDKRQADARGCAYKETIVSKEIDQTACAVDLWLQMVLLPSTELCSYILY